MNLKRKHHFVSQFYLKNWYNSDGKINVWDGEKSYKAVTKSIAFETDFYQIVPLKSKQVELFNSYMKNAGLERLSSYQLIFKECIKTQSLINIHSRFSEMLDIPIPKILSSSNREFSHNTLEDKFSLEEDSFSKVINKIISEDRPELTLSDYDILTHFFVFQLTKTPKKIKNVMEMTREMPVYKECNFNEEENKTFNLFLSQCLAEAYYLNCLSNLHEIRIYRNTSNINFITSDDPCFNQKLSDKKAETLIQLPISPQIMIELVDNSYSEHHTKEIFSNLNNCKTKEDKDNVVLNDLLFKFYDFDEDDVTILNKKLFQNKDRFIYAHSENDIISLQNM